MRSWSGVVAIAIMALVAACEKDPSMAEGGSVEHLRQPPPKPPACPPVRSESDFPEAEGIRVIEAGGTRFYFPKEWVSGYFVDEALARYNQTPRSVTPILGKFQPDLHADECPGVVHTYLGGRASAYGDFAAVLPSREPRSGVARSLVATGVKKVFFKVSALLPPDDGLEGEIAGFAGKQVARGWAAVNPNTYADTTTNPKGQCVVALGNPRSELIAFRRLPSGSGVGFVLDAQDTPPDRWREICEELPGIHRWLTTRPDARKG